MRSWLKMLVTAAAVAVTVIGTAGADPGAPAAPAAPGAVVAADRFSVLAGSPDAPVQLELFCDPQCPICGRFESASGAALGRELGSGRVALTYRWLTFLDARRGNDASARMAAALIRAADPGIPATAYQAFVQNLYRAGGDPDTDAIAAIARDSGIGEYAVDRIVSGQPFVDTVAMNAVNWARLNQVKPEQPGTPTVYDPKSNTVVDTDAPGWLDRLISGDAPGAPPG